MTKVVIEMEGSLVTRILVDSDDVELLLLDREVAPVSREYVLADVLEAPAAVDELARVTPTFNPERVERAFREVREGLDAPGVNGAPVDDIRSRLQGVAVSQSWRPETAQRIERIFAEEGFVGLKVAPGAGVSPHTCDLYYVFAGNSQRCVATLDFDGAGWTAVVFGAEYDGDERRGHFMKLAVPAGASAFIAAAHLLEFFDTHATGEYALD